MNSAVIFCAFYWVYFLTKSRGWFILKCRLFIVRFFKNKECDSEMDSGSSGHGRSSIYMKTAVRKACNFSAVTR